MNADTIRATLLAGFGATVSVRPRRPGLYQVEIPAHLADGDAAQIYVREGDDGRLAVSDLGHTLQRLSYTQLTSDAMSSAVERLARRHGFAFADGDLHVAVPPDELLAAALGLAQIEAEAEATVVAAVTRGARAERFKELVREAIREAFPQSHEFNYHEAASDPAGLYALDAVIRGQRVLGVAIVANDVDAESAIATKLVIAPHMTRPRFAAITRDINALRDGTRKRLLQQYGTVLPSFEEDRASLRNRLGDLADAA